MKVRPIVAWFDAWIGVYYDRAGHRLYILPIPFVGLVVDLRKADR